MVLCVWNQGYREALQCRQTSTARHLRPAMCLALKQFLIIAHSEAFDGCCVLLNLHFSHVAPHEVTTHGLICTRAPWGALGKSLMTQSTVEVSKDLPGIQKEGPDSSEVMLAAAREQVYSVALSASRAADAPSALDVCK